MPKHSHSPTSRTHRTRDLVIPLHAVAFLAAGSLAIATPPLYEVELHDPLPPFEYVTPLGMNEAGEVVGYTAFDAFDPSATGVLVDPVTGLAPLSLIDKGFNFPFAINETGQIVGQSGQQAFFWEDGTTVPLAVPPAFFSASARDVNNAGVVVGSYGDSDFVGPRHCYWPTRASQPSLLRGIFAGSNDGAAWDINEAGQVAGVSGGAVGVFFAVRWNTLTATPIQIGPLPGGMNSEALAMNELGDVAGRTSFPDFSIEAMFWRSADGLLTGLGFLPGGASYSEAFDVNDAQQVVGVAEATGVLHAFLWEDGLMHDLNGFLLPGGPAMEYLARATAINNDGKIAAEAVLGPTGFPRAIAILTPIVAGDMNCDDVLDEGDVAPFVLSLVDPAAYEAAFDCNILRADLSGDGEADGRDIRGFVDALVAE